jgi:hypothetical protein
MVMKLHRACRFGRNPQFMRGRRPPLFNPVIGFTT